MNEPLPPRRQSPLAFIDLGFLATFAILIFVGVLAGKSPAQMLPSPLPPNGELLFLGLGGLAILLAPRIARGKMFSGRGGEPAKFFRGLIRNVITEFGVILGFIVSYITREPWPVVVLGVMGMISTVIAMRSTESGGES